MDVGMLWFDDSSAALEKKISQAAAHYKEKFGRTPTLCLVHPEMLNGSSGGAVKGLEVRSARTIIPHHFLIGIEDEDKSAGSN